MRLRLHKLVEDYVAIHEAQQTNHNMVPMVMCKNGKVATSVRNCEKMMEAEAKYGKKKV